MCYYGLTSTAASLSDNIFLNYILLILVEIPAVFVCLYTLDAWGRKVTLATAQVLAGVSCMVAGLVAHVTWLQVHRCTLYIRVGPLRRFFFKCTLISSCD